MPYAMPPGQPAKNPPNLVLCFDGTGNTFNGSDADTNVVKLLRNLNRTHPNQYHYYQTGIGTYVVNETSVNKSTLGEAKSWFSKQLDQGVGSSFDAHVMAGYKFLMRYYEDGAKIYMFGFSRGAFTAKFLAQMINTVGLLCKGNEEMVPFAFRLYQRYIQGKTALRGKKLKDEGLQDLNTVMAEHNQSEEDEVCEDSDIESSDSDDDSGHASGAESEDDDVDADEGTSLLSSQSKHRGHARAKTAAQREEEATKAALEEVRAFSRTFCRKDSSTTKSTSTSTNIKIHFLGLWDCVASVAVLETKAAVPMAILGTARHVRHAVAIDEKRVKFRPSLLSQDIATIQRTKNNNKGKNKVQNGDASNGGPSVQSIIDEVKEEDLKEVWFPGSHCDVGGGWPAQNAVEIPTSPKSLTWWDRLNYFWSGSVHTEASERVQMSDVALAWMIDELREVNKKEQIESPGAETLHWNKKRLKKFKKNFKEWKQKAQDETVKEEFKLGVIHHPLQFYSGTAFNQVLIWKFMEYLPFIPRWELVDNKWVHHRFRPSMYGTRDIPWKAVLHESVCWRLNQDKTYRPTNNHGENDDKNKAAPCLKPDGLSAYIEHSAWSTKNHQVWTFPDEKK